MPNSFSDLHNFPQNQNSGIVQSNSLNFKGPKDIHDMERSTVLPNVGRLATLVFIFVSDCVFGSF